jgi:hypothetical protein
MQVNKINLTLTFIFNVLHVNLRGAHSGLGIENEVSRAHIARVPLGW